MGLRLAPDPTFKFERPARRKLAGAPGGIVGDSEADKQLGGHHAER